MENTYIYWTENRKRNGKSYDSWNNYHPKWKELALMANFNQVWGEENIENVGTIGWTRSYHILKFGKINKNTLMTEEKYEKALDPLSGSYLFKIVVSHILHSSLRTSMLGNVLNL